MDFHGKLLADRYRLESLLAEGGMGEVWIARHLSLDIQVAVKIMLATALSNEALRARFAREAKACAQLRSPHVVQVFDYGVADELPFLVMELLDGEDLTSLITTRKIVPLEEAADLVMQAAKGLAAAHACGIVHRDVKPSNLFVARMGADRVLKVLDFGIAKTFDDGPKMTRTNVVLGSPYYMSPEQLVAAPIDARTDVWSLGVVAFLLATGELPFKGPTPLDVGFKIRVGERPKPSAIRPELGGDVDRFFDRALAHTPADRFGGVLELAEELQRLGKPASRPSFSRESARGTTKMEPSAQAAAIQAMAQPTQIGHEQGSSSLPAGAAQPELVRPAVSTLKMRESAKAALPIAQIPPPQQPGLVQGFSARPATASPIPFASQGDSAPHAAASQTLLEAAVPAPPARGSAVRNTVMAAVTLASLAALGLSTTLWLKSRNPPSPGRSAAPVAEASVAATGPIVVPVASTAPPASAAPSSSIAAAAPSASPAPFGSASASASPSAVRPYAARTPPRPIPQPVYTPPPPPPASTTTTKRPIGLGF